MPLPPAFRVYRSDLKNRWLWHHSSTCCKAAQRSSCHQCQALWVCLNLNQIKATTKEKTSAASSSYFREWTVWIHVLKVKPVTCTQEGWGQWIRRQDTNGVLWSSRPLWGLEPLPLLSVVWCRMTMTYVMFAQPVSAMNSRTKPKNSKRGLDASARFHECLLCFFDINRSIWLHNAIIYNIHIYIHYISLLDTISILLYDHVIV